MKKLFTLFAMLTLLVSLNAQTINYQAVLRDTTDGKNELVRSQSGIVTISILGNQRGDSFDFVVWEAIPFKTNADGMVNLPIDLSEVDAQLEEYAADNEIEEANIDWRNNMIIAVFAYGEGYKDTITLETPVTAVPYAVQAKDGNLTTGVITSYINNTSSSEQSDFNLVWNALMNNANLHKAVRDSIVEYLKDNYKYAKEILYSYMSQVTPEDVNEAYAQVQGLDQEVKDAVDTVLKHYLQKNHDLLIEVLEYYAQTATEDEMRTLYNDLKANGPAATKIKELMNEYFGRYLAYKGLVCDTTRKTLCDAIAAMNAGGDAPQTELKCLTIPGGNYFSGNVCLYYMDGDTYRQAFARDVNRDYTQAETKWSSWEEGTSYETLYYRETPKPSGSSRDLYVNGDHDFLGGEGHGGTGTFDVTWDTPIDPANTHSFGDGF